MIILPARLASTRLPEKLLKVAQGKSILQHTYEAALGSKLAEAVTVAVDNDKLSEEVKRFGGSWEQTSLACQSGTDRLAEVASRFPDVDIFVNVQSDEPEITGSTIDRVIQQLIDSPEADIATAGTPIRDMKTLQDPSCVKIVMGNTNTVEIYPATDSAGERKTNDDFDEETKKRKTNQGRAVYFSRTPIPCLRDGIEAADFNRDPPIFWHHIGIYAYRRDFLSWFSSTPPSTLEELEKLEQLRAIEAGKIIQVVEIEHAAPGIDTEKDYQDFLKRLSMR